MDRRIYLFTLIAVAWLTGARDIALGQTPNLWAWGNIPGTGGTTGVPLQVSGLTGVVAAGGGYLFSLALKDDGTVWAWGTTDAGEVGNGSTDYDSNVPVEVSGLTSVVAIAADDIHSLALKADGTVWAWGDNIWGELGNGSSANSSDLPVQVNDLTGAVAIAAGGNEDSTFGDFSLALLRATGPSGPGATTFTVNSATA